ncbi:MAG: glycerol-3-phosphate acyltransferase, partial [Acidobacteria bacterium]|nr:glycerol-3-phosphate acyltransferase [Acidobacteriota bacterium]
MKPRSWRSQAIGVGTAAALGYLAGSTPVADFVARRSGSEDDLRSVGSGNPGAMNAAQSLGSRWG